MKFTIAFLLSLSLLMAVTPLHADSSTSGSGTTTEGSSDKGSGDTKGSGGAEPECN